ncbi:hypothetical protein [Micromonospora carbonacea]|uniref:Uncharacterized protein n=1 Tax=Micromonospora carbonacea TaxID=47853 RepID=A0A1C5A9Y3_9ACTN|nr:hypothetical protein [Micromonospora carbonacea]SCF41814.1 hypothetical protein GA0070563_1122 [Micromonospora carbonacea]
MNWAVYTSWQALDNELPPETRRTASTWEAARRMALYDACLAGVRYVTVQGPDDAIHGEWDRYTNRWREYRRLY